MFRLFVWEILHSTIRKMNKHVLKIQKELEEAKEKLARQHKRVSCVLIPAWLEVTTESAGLSESIP